MIRVRSIQVCWLAVAFGGGSYAVAADGLPVESELARAARTFRMQVYDTFRSDRAEYDRRTRQAQKIINDWKRRGSPADEKPRLTRWYREAARASHRNLRRPLPEYRSPGSVRRRPTPPPALPALPPDSPPGMARIALPLRPAQGVTLTPTDPPLPPLHRRSNPLTTGPATVAPSPSSTPSVTDEMPASPVDLAVLTSRIRSFNLTLSEIEGELSQPGPWRVEQLALLIDQVERLFGRRQLSQLYYDALTPPQQQLVEGFTSADPTLALLDQRLFEARVALIDANFGLSPSSSQGELKQLRSLSERIKSWSLPETEANKP